MSYFDHASTSHPKDPRVIDALVEAMGAAGSPGRGTHGGARRAEAGLQRARERARALLGTTRGEVSFTLNATDALNLALKGFLRPGDEVVTTQVEHNSVLRPLRGMQRRHGLRLKVVPCDDAGRVSLEALRRAIGLRTRLVVIAHASNVTGALQPVAELGRWLRAKSPAPRLLVDAAQTAGYRDLREVSDVADLIAVAGHKGPGGPAGTGFLWRRSEVRLTPLREGGTGGSSESLHQPTVPPHDLEAGTQNYPGIVGLSEAIRIRLEEHGLGAVRRARTEFTRRFLEVIGEFESVRCWGPCDPSAREPVFPLQVRGMSVEEAGVLLELHAGITQRGGLHCAPGIHQALGTGEEGALRWSFGPFPGDKEIRRSRDTLRVLTSAFEAGPRTRGTKEEE